MKKRVPSKIPSKELPEKVRKAIEKIMAHRKEIRMNSLPFLSSGGGVIIATALLMEYTAAKIATLAVGLPTLTSLGLASLKGHQKQYNQEELELFRALTQANNPKIKSIIANYPYLVVNREGDIVGKRTNPRMGFLPIGRRRIATEKKRLRQRTQRQRKRVK